VRALLGLNRLLVRLTRAFLPAELATFQAITGVSTTMFLGMMARYRIADLLAEGPRTAEELAARTGLDADALHRVLRGAAYHELIALADDGRFSETRITRTLRTGNPAGVREFAEYWATPSNLAAWMHTDHALRTGRSPFDHLFGKTVWDWFTEHPYEELLFARAMMGLTTQDGPVVATSYPWSEVRRVCDVGGGRGTLLSELLLHHAHLSGVLLDAPGVVASAEALLRHRGVLDRVERVAGSFFEPITVQAEVYTVKNILHDWGDDVCLRILKNIRSGAPAGSKVVIAEAIVERNNSRAVAALADVQMLMACSDGRERDVTGYHRLLTEAGFRPGRVFRHPMIDLIEGVA
jgi:hypothetical protein